MTEILHGIWVSDKWFELTRDKIEKNKDKVEAYKKFMKDLEDSFRKNSRA